MELVAKRSDLIYFVQIGEVFYLVNLRHCSYNASYLVDQFLKFGYFYPVNDSEKNDAALKNKLQSVIEEGKGNKPRESDNEVLQKYYKSKDNKRTK